jgi:uncharacterized protein
MTRTSWLFVPAVLLLAVSPVLAYISPGQPTGFVNDYADVLTPEQETLLESQLNTVATTEGSEIAVVTVPNIGEDTIENFAVSLFAEWGIGKETLDNGVLLLVAIEEREMRIEVGYGLEGTITDAQASWIIKDILTPAFKNSDYYTGIEGAVNSIRKAISGETPLPADEITIPAIDDTEVSVLVSFLYFIVFILSIVLGRSKSIWLGGVLGALIGGVGGFFLGTVQTAILGGLILGLVGLALDYILSQGGGPGSGLGGGMFGGTGRGGGFGSSGGGFGGFGGGSSGGGGASGRW